MTQHALLSPSSAHRWLACPASVGASQGIPDTSSVHAAEGSAAHELAAQCLGDTLPMEPAPLVGQQASNGVAFTAEMAGFVGQYTAFVRVQAAGGELMVEQALDLAAITGEAGAQGTADAVIIAGPLLHVIDLKYGRGVRVEADNNPQLILYALAALDTLDPLGDIVDVALTIHQPRLEHVSTWQTTAEHLRSLLPRIRAAAHRALQLTVTPPGPADFTPGDEQCRWCPARATCTALASQVLDTVKGDFADVSRDLAPQLEPATHAVSAYDSDTLGRCMAALPLVELWAKAVRGETETRLLRGDAVPGFKLVAGRKGARQWADAAEAEATLRAMRLKVEEMYDLKLISPTTAEKLQKAGTLGPRQWAKLQGHITQVEGAPSVAPDADKRPPLALAASADDFDDLTALEPLT